VPAASWPPQPFLWSVNLPGKVAVVVFLIPGQCMRGFPTANLALLSGVQPGEHITMCSGCLYACDEVCKTGKSEHFSKQPLSSGEKNWLKSKRNILIFTCNNQFSCWSDARTTLHITFTVECQWSAAAQVPCHSEVILRGYLVAGCQHVQWCNNSYSNKWILSLQV